jgi:hypothetical protein
VTRPYVSAAVQVRFAGRWLAAIVTAVHAQPRGDNWRDPVDVAVFLTGGGIRPQRMVERALDDSEDGFWRWAPETGK